MTSYHPEA